MPCALDWLNFLLACPSVPACDSKDLRFTFPLIEQLVCAVPIYWALSDKPL